MADQEQGNIRQDFNSASVGLNMDQSLNQIKKGTVTYALNALVDHFDGNAVNYLNEPGNELCLTFPENFVLIGHHFISEQNKHIFFLTNPDTKDSQIGYMDNNDCEYKIYINSPCLGFDIKFPIHKIVHRITNCSVEIYWTDNIARRYLDLNNIPYKESLLSEKCDPTYTNDVDCNQLRIQPNFNIPQIEIKAVISGGNLISGTYQFAIQYSDASGNPLTSYYSVTNPVPLADPNLTSVKYDYPIGKSIELNIFNLDTTGQFEYFNIAVIKTINAISSVELIGTYFIQKDSDNLTFSGQQPTNIRLSIDDIFERFPYYEKANDLTVAQDILIWSDLISVDRINYQQIANKISLKWETWRIPATEDYSNEWNASHLVGYPRDEIVAFEIIFLLKNGKETDSFHIPGKLMSGSESNQHIIQNTNPDFIENGQTAPYWKIYNTATFLGFDQGYVSDKDYKGPYQYGDFAYWESTDEYPCETKVWGDLAGKKIRHHKFPDVSVSPIFESRQFSNLNALTMENTAIFPLGVKIDPIQVETLIQNSELTAEQKDDIVGFKIVRGDRATNKSIIGKGILRNVNTYTREDKEYYFPNYPYNDLNADPFINSINNAFTDICDQFTINITGLVYDAEEQDNIAEVTYVDCNTNKVNKKIYKQKIIEKLCSIGKPRITKGQGTVTYINYDLYNIMWYSSRGNELCGGFRVEYEDITEGKKQTWINGPPNPEAIQVKVVKGTKPRCVEFCDRGFMCGTVYLIRFLLSYTEPSTCVSDIQNKSLPGITDSRRQVFNSPETSFGQPFLGNILKLESVIFGKGKAHFVEVKDHAKYKFITEEAQRKALNSSAKLGAITLPDFNVQAMFAAYQAYLTIYINGITRKNFAYSFNSIASYDYSLDIPNGLGIKQRNIDLNRYLIPGVISIGDDHDMNNYQRESSVFLRTDIDKEPLPFPKDSPNANSIGITEFSRFTISDVGNCNKPGKEKDIKVVAYYASLKKKFDNQWGQIYSYSTVDTGYQFIFGVSQNRTIFGGDTFIGRFAFKTKVPFFFDNRVNAPDDSDIFYDEIGNIGYPKYWHSSRSILKNYSIPYYSESDPITMANLISYKAHNFDCPSEGFDYEIIDESSSTTTTTSSTTLQSSTGEITVGSETYYDGYFYLFAYGIPSFYCESSYNLDLRQAYNNKEGDFWPHVSNSIPDDWVQEKNVSIINDNTYYYNTTFSKQNKETVITHLPPDWEEKLCFTNFPFRAIYSDYQETNSDNRVNSWRIYRAVSKHDFPQNFGRLISLDGIQNRAVLARFENKTLLYNSLLTMDTSNPQSVYVGNPLMFKNPPLDFAETDLGYIGSQHKMLIKIPQGQITVDAKRGQVFLINNDGANDLSILGSGMNKFFTEHLSFEIKKHFPEVNIDNNFNGIGLHGVHDTKYDRVLITKLDYVPLLDDIKYDSDIEEFYVEEEFIQIVYDCNLQGSAIEQDRCELIGEAHIVLQ